MILQTMTRAAFFAVVGMWTAASLPAVETNVFGPRTYQRVTGAPITEREGFVTTAGPARVRIVNGAANGTGRVSAAVVVLNGVTLATPSMFSQKVAELHFETQLLASNQIGVEVRGAPGSFLTITIVQDLAPANPWSRVTDMPTPRVTSGAAIAVINGRATVIGHHEGNPGSGRVNEEYDAGADSWAGKTPHPRGEGRQGLNKNAVAGTNLFLFGGANIWNNYHTQTVDSYDPTTDQWQLDRSTYPLTAAYIATASLVGQIYCFGGMNYNAFPYAASYRYDAASGVFTPLANLPTPRAMASAFVKDGKIWVAGGIQYPSTLLSSIDIYDPGTNTWTAGPTLPLSNGFLYWAGAMADGSVYAIYSEAPAHQVVVYKYLPSSDSWFLYPPAPLPQQGFGVAQVGNLLYLMGADNPLTGLVQRFQP